MAIPAASQRANTVSWLSNLQVVGQSGTNSPESVLVEKAARNDQQKRAESGGQQETMKISATRHTWFLRMSPF